MYYAVIETGGKQYRVSEGDVVFIEKLEAKGKITFSNVLTVSNGKKLEFGTPYIKGAKVNAKVLKHGKGEKITVFTYKPKKDSKRKLGHRQPYTQVEIESIEGVEGVLKEEPEKKTESKTAGSAAKKSTGTARKSASTTKKSTGAAKKSATPKKAAGSTAKKTTAAAAKKTTGKTTGGTSAAKKTTTAKKATTTAAAKKTTPAKKPAASSKKAGTTSSAKKSATTAKKSTATTKKADNES